jgi:hypothetical protein
MSTFGTPRQARPPQGAQWPASHLPKLDMGLHMTCTPIPVSKNFGPANHSSQPQNVRSSPNSGLIGGALHLSLKADFRGPLSPQEQTFWAGVQNVRL